VKDEAVAQRIGNARFDIAAHRLLLGIREVGADEFEVRARILQGDPDGGIDPFDHALARLEPAEIADRAGLPYLWIARLNLGIAKRQRNDGDAALRQPVMAFAMRGEILAGAEMRVRRPDDIILKPLHRQIIGPRARPFIVPEDIFSGRVKMDDAGRLALRAEPERAPQHQEVERRFPFLPLDDVDPLARDQLFGEPGRYPGKPLCRKTGGEHRIHLGTRDLRARAKRGVESGIVGGDAVARARSVVRRARPLPRKTIVPENRRRASHPFRHARPWSSSQAWDRKRHRRR